MTYPTPKLPESELPTPPQPANDNSLQADFLDSALPTPAPDEKQPPPAANDNQKSSPFRSATRFAQTVVKRANSYLTMYSVLQAADKGLQDRLEQRAQQLVEEAQQRQDADEQAQQEQKSTAPAQSSKYHDLINTSIHQVRRTQAQEKQCYEEQKIGFDRPMTPRQVDVLEQEMLRELQELGRTDEQEYRLLEIYDRAQHPTPPQDVKDVYQSVMGEIAVQRGRGVMDRDSNAALAMETDRTAFAETLRRTNDLDATLEAIKQNSPNTASMSSEQLDRYSTHLQEMFLDKYNSLQLVGDRGDRSGQGETERDYTGLPPQLPEWNQVTLQDQKFFEVEYADLQYSHLTDLPLSAQEEYSRQLG